MVNVPHFILLLDIPVLCYSERAYYFSLFMFKKELKPLQLRLPVVDFSIKHA